jgi:phosphate transport system substrate-binding protein
MAQHFFGTMADRFRPGTRRLCNALLVTVLVAQAASPVYGEQAGPISAVMPDARLSGYSPEAQVAGAMKIQGSDTMYPLLTRLSTEFRRRQPQVSIDVKGGGSAKALADFLRVPKSPKVSEEKAGQVLLVSSSRELMPSEIRQFSNSHGDIPLAIPVALDAVALYVHRDNPIEGLTLDQVDAIFSLSRLRGYPIDVANWGQLGLSANWQNAPIRMFGRDRRSGTRTFFQEHVLIGGDFKPTMQEEPGAASVILALSQSPLGIAFNGLGLHSSMVRIVPLAEKQGAPFVAPSDATLADQTYPLRRVLYLYLDTPSPASLSPAAKEFMSFISSREGQEAVIRAGFFPLPMTQIQQSLAARDLSAAGSH